MMEVLPDAMLAPAFSSVRRSSLCSGFKWLPVHRGEAVNIFNIPQPHIQNLFEIMVGHGCLDPHP
jgi:hypothetical protein